jgi:hypothetical protein
MCNTETERNQEYKEKRRDKNICFSLRMFLFRTVFTEYVREENLQSKVEKN